MDELAKVLDDILAQGRCKEEYGDFDIDFAYGIGVREDGDSVSDVYKKADQLMYKHKAAVKQR